jgi:radical SAM superfamily enzyme YgiQ (UPF0313 family)
LSRRPQILLINPWIHDFAAYDLWAQPLGLLIIANQLRNKGWEPSFVDFLDPDHPDMPRLSRKRFEQGHFHRTPIEKPVQLEKTKRTFCSYGVSPEAIARSLTEIPRPEVILVTSHMTYWYPGVQATINLLRVVFPGTPIALGGIYASLMPSHARLLGADEVVTGPAETNLPEALFKLCGHSTEIEVEQSLGFSPALDLVRTNRFLPLLTSRGCPFSCVYCASKKLAPKYVTRPVTDAMNEIEDALSKWPFKDIALYDDAFLYNAQVHALPILKAASERFQGLRWHSPNGLHASAITMEVATAMKRAGFETLRLGLESTTDEFHRNTGGKTTWAYFKRAVENLRSAGFAKRQIGAYILVGLPGQTRAAIEEDVEKALEVGAHPKLAEYSPIPGTALWERALLHTKYPIDEDPIYHNCTLAPCADSTVTPEFIGALRKKVAASMDKDEPSK